MSSIKSIHNSRSQNFASFLNLIVVLNYELIFVTTAIFHFVMLQFIKSYSHTKDVFKTGFENIVI